MSADEHHATKDVPAVSRAVAILDLAARSDEPLTLADVARALGLPKSSAHGLCATLANLGLLRRRGGAFVLGGHVMRWANAFAARSDVAEEFSRLWDETPALRVETLTLTILDGADVVYIASRHGEDPLGITFRIGMRLPAAFTATGKAMLSTMEINEVRGLYRRGLPAPMTERTVRTLDVLEEELDEVRRRGFSIDDHQVRDGMVCVGAPVFDFSGERAIGGFAISILDPNVETDRIATLGADVIRYARLLSQRLGS
ncbi:IclR family transcriptional regulator [Ancylobacter defluvii]|uniref:IclR family transcriptional regulator n=1 Tax=Ancylobacter defluvii TaxID=1282440 RepID=A0A9W6NAA6_9HYPH|nr:IclR family transcriptional regulator [Ancylobacter defluvii]MBS7590474.1 IclR family transcriptional regulator [Ancylobacter defluvii]GLK83395.1 IclR family transcriptional regulator [Ancylobacter defluvii]